MDMYGLPPPPPDFFHFDDSLNFHTTDNTFSSATSSASNSNNSLLISSNLPSNNTCLSADITSDFYVPSEDAAELEWISHFVESSSLPDFTPTTVSSMVSIRPDSSFTTSQVPTKLPGPLITPPEPMSPATGKTSPKDRSYNFPRQEGPVRRCSHCASEKTPQWRTGPLGPKTLCNACGVRYKSGRLVPEYRPAASPTFVLTQHSNSHRKVLELRRQKEMLMAQQQRMQMYQQQQ